MEHGFRMPEKFADRLGIEDLVSLKVLVLFVIGSFIIVKNYYIQWKLRVCPNYPNLIAFTPDAFYKNP